jgi:hypothetical protein
MTINFSDLETALYHIRVNYFFCADASDLRVQFSARGNGDTVIDVWDKNNKHIGDFFLSTLIEEITLLRENKISFADLYANNVKDEES